MSAQLPQAAFYIQLLGYDQDPREIRQKALQGQTRGGSMTAPRPPVVMFADLQVNEHFRFVTIDSRTFRVVDDDDDRGIGVVVAVEDCRCAGDHHYADDNGSVYCARPYALVERVTATEEEGDE